MSTFVPPDASQLIVDYGCGFQFAAGNEVGSVGLVLEFVDHEAASIGDVPRSSSLADGTWTGAVRVGADLFSNWCDDVIEPDEPVPVVDEVWEIVDGSITISGDPLANELQAEVSGILLERNGVRVGLDPVRVANNCWGCFAG